MRRSYSRWLAVLAAAATAAALLLGAPQRAETAASSSVALRIMSFNIFYGGDELVGLSS
jgi:hypothetical protein